LNNLSMTFRVVGPLFLMLMAGYVCRQLKMFDDNAVAKMTGVTYRVFLAALMFNNIYKCDIAQLTDWRLIAITIGLSLANLLLALPGAFLLEKDPKRRGALAQGMYQNSYVLYGQPIVTSMYGPESSGMVALVATAALPLRNLISVVMLSFICGGKINVKKLLGNPFVYSSIIAFAFVLLGIKLPYVVEKTVSEFAQIGTPLAMFLLGGTFTFKGFTKDMRSLIWGVAGRLIIVPLILTPVAILLGLRDAPLLAMLILLAAPTASSAHILTNEMNADHILSGNLVVLSSALSVITVFIFIFILRSAGYIGLAV